MIATFRALPNLYKSILYVLTPSKNSFAHEPHYQHKFSIARLQYDNQAHLDSLSRLGLVKMWFDGETHDTSITTRLEAWLLWLKQHSDDHSCEKTKNILAQIEDDPRQAHGKIFDRHGKSHKSQAREAARRQSVQRILFCELLEFDVSSSTAVDSSQAADVSHGANLPFGFKEGVWWGPEKKADDSEETVRKM